LPRAGRRIVDLEADPAIPARPRGRYGSRGMAERRARILSQAQVLLDEAGVEGFTTRELSRRADVALRTLYNLFGSKEDIIAQAITERHAGLTASLSPLPPPEDLEALLSRSDWILDRAAELRRYCAAMVGVYFSPTVDQRIYDSLRMLGGGGGPTWVERAAVSGLLIQISDADIAALNTLLTSASFANVGDWVAGRITPEEMKSRARLNFLVCIQPLARPGFRSRVALAIQAELRRRRQVEAGRR
jgi:AcrR family transcriptional regulator